MCLLSVMGLKVQEETARQEVGSAVRSNLFVICLSI